MKVENYKEGKSAQVSAILDRQGYILDDQSAKIFGNDKIYRANEHIRIWKKLKSDRPTKKHILSYPQSELVISTI